MIAASKDDGNGNTSPLRIEVVDASVRDKSKEPKDLKEATDAAAKGTANGGATVHAEGACGPTFVLKSVSNHAEDINEHSNKLT